MLNEITKNDKWYVFPSHFDFSQFGSGSFSKSSWKQLYPQGESMFGEWKVCDSIPTQYGLLKITEILRLQFVSVNRDTKATVCFS